MEDGLLSQAADSGSTGQAFYLDIHTGRYFDEETLRSQKSSEFVRLEESFELSKLSRVNKLLKNGQMQPRERGAVIAIDLEGESGPLVVGAEMNSPSTKRHALRERFIEPN